MNQIDAFLVVVATYAEATGAPDTTVSWRVFGDSKKVAALQAGKDIQVKRLTAAYQWLSDHWPLGAVWPDSVERPAPADVAGAAGAETPAIADPGASNGEREAPAAPAPSEASR